MLTLTDGIRLRRLPRLTIRTKTLAASAFALVCLIGMGVIVQLTTSRVAHDLSELSQSNFPIRAAASALNDNILAVHMRVFRYVSWAGNGVSHPLMENLSSEIAIDFGLIQEEFDELATRADLTAAEKAELAALQTKIKEYERTTRDVLEVGRTDAAMATMMLGQTDDKYVGVEEDIRKIFAVIAADFDFHCAQLGDRHQDRSAFSGDRIDHLSRIQRRGNRLYRQIDHQADHVDNRRHAEAVGRRHRSYAALPRAHR